MNMHYFWTSSILSVFLLVVGAVMFYKNQDKFILYV